MPRVTRAASHTSHSWPLFCRGACSARAAARLACSHRPTREETPMAKKGRKRRARKKNAANHGKRPNA
jgi:hypothetical protein